MTALLAIAWRFLRAVPWPAWAALALLAAGLLWGHLRYNAGQADAQAKWDAAVAAQVAADAKIPPKQAGVSARVVTEYVDRVRVIREKGDTIVKEVKTYVPVNSCPLPAGFRVLHDAAAKGEVPDPAAIADAAAVPAQAAAETVAGNYAICLANAQQVRSLQEWITQQSAIGGAND